MSIIATVLHVEITNLAILIILTLLLLLALIHLAESPAIGMAPIRLVEKSLAIFALRAGGYLPMEIIYF